jgi:ferredoxin
VVPTTRHADAPGPRVTEPVRLVVNASLCDGHGICVLRCPELITLDEWGYAAVEPGTVTDGRVDRRVRRVRRAVAACPNRALELVPVQPAPGARAAPLLVVVAQPTHNELPRDTEQLPRMHNRNDEGG